MQSLPLLGSEVLEPETDDALSLLRGTGREDPEDRLQLGPCRMCAGAEPAHLGGEEAQLALHVLVDEVLLAGEATGPPAKLRLHCFTQTQLVGPSE